MQAKAAALKPEVFKLRWVGHSEHSTQATKP
jgi:hypothetical protein